MMFMELDQGGDLRKETGLATPKIIRFLIEACSRRRFVLSRHGSSRKNSRF